MEGNNGIDPYQGPIFDHPGCAAHSLVILILFRRLEQETDFSLQAVYGKTIFQEMGHPQ